MTRTVQIKYIKPKDFPSFFVTGVWGEVGTTGQVIMNAFFDSRPLPEYLEAPVDDDNTADIYSGNVRFSDDSALIRELCCRLIMDPSTARSVGKWLIAEADRNKEAGQ